MARGEGIIDIDGSFVFADELLGTENYGRSESGGTGMSTQNSPLPVVSRVGLQTGQRTGPVRVSKTPNKIVETLYKTTQELVESKFGPFVYPLTQSGRERDRAQAPVHSLSPVPESQHAGFWRSVL